MVKCLFDTCAISLVAFDGIVPDKWKENWNRIRGGGEILLFIAPIISETYYQNVKTYGKNISRNKLRWCLGLRSTQIHKLDERDGVRAGEIKSDYKRLSLTDCFILAVGKRQGAVIFTTDAGMKAISKRVGVKTKYMPLEACS